MIFENFKEYTAINESGGIDVEETVYYLKEDETNEKQMIIFTEDGRLRSVKKEDFELVQTRIPIKTVYCVYRGKKNTLKLHDKYSVFAVREEGYFIVDNDYFFDSWPISYFLEEEDYLSLKEKNELDDFMKAHKQQLDYKNGITKYYSEKEILIEKVIATINECSYIHRKPKPIVVSKYEDIQVFPWFGDKRLVLQQPTNEIRRNDNVNDNIKLYTSLNKLNKFPIEILGKYQIINNYLIMLECLNISRDVLVLVQETTNMIQYLCDCEINEEITKEVNHLLDKTINYLKELKNNKDIEESYIEKQLAENIYKIIQDNANLFESMTTDNELIMKHFKNNSRS